MLGMVLGNSIGLELYVATPSFPDKQQYVDSQILLALIKGSKLEKGIEIVPLDNLLWHGGFFQAIKEPRNEIMLPFLVRMHNDETGIVLGDTGLEEVIDALNSMHRVGVTIYDLRTGNTSTYYLNQQH